MEKRALVILHFSVGNKVADQCGESLAIACCQEVDEFSAPAQGHAGVGLYIVGKCLFLVKVFTHWCVDTRRNYLGLYDKARPNIAYKHVSFTAAWGRLSARKNIQNHIWRNSGSDQKPRALIDGCHYGLNRCGVLQRPEYWLC